MIDIERFVKELHENLTENILPYWIDRMVDPRGGFYGCRDGKDILIRDAVKGTVLNSRILWTFSAAYRYTRNPEYLKMAIRTKDYIAKHFLDNTNGGVYWSVNYDGTPCDTRKQFYALAFTIYGMSEYYSITGEEEALQIACDLFRLIETHSRDRNRGGYIEATTADWKPIDDMRLSDKDYNASKTMNTHLHILEGYTALLKVNRTPETEEAVRNLIGIFLEHIVREDGHLGLFFDDDWKAQDCMESYGHDIEASWLLLEAAHALNDTSIIPSVLKATEKIAKAGLTGLAEDYSMYYEKRNDGTLDKEKHWWVQAESVVGQIYLYKYHGHEKALQSAWQSWQYILNNIVDHENGEWFWSRKDGCINRSEDKAGFWKCPYHNSRMCIETITRLHHAAE